jgi:hypothetical protein
MCCAPSCHRGADRSQPDADDRKTQTTRGATQVIAGRRGHRTSSRGVDRAAAAPVDHQLEHDRPSSSLGCWPVCAPTRWCATTSATSDAPMTAPSSGSAAKATKTDASPRTRPRRHPRALPRQPSGALPGRRQATLPHRGTRPRDRRSRRCPSAATAQPSPAAPLQCRALRAFRQAGIDSTRAKGALLHGLRH